MVKRKWGASMVVDEIRPLSMEKTNSVGLVHPACLGLTADWAGCGLKL
jgi:hypothetical protein